MRRSGGAIVGVAMAAMAVMAVSSPAHADPATAASIPTPPSGAQSVTFGYTGGVQTYTVGAGVGWVQIKAIGGPGGMNSSADGGSQSAEVNGTVKVSPGDTLSLSVAGAGGQSGGNWTAGGPGGWGGLGASGGDGASSDDSLRNAGSGGGASTVQLVSGSTTSTLVFAGGGGGKGGASGDPDHAGDGGSGGDNGWMGGDGHGGTEGSTGGSGGSGGKAATSVGEAGKHGDELGGNGGAGGGGYLGGTSGTGGHLTSAGGGGGAGSSYANPDLVLGPTVKPSGINWCNPVVCFGQNVPNGSIVITPIPQLTTTVQLAVQNPQVEVGANAGPLSAVMPAVDGYAPSGTVTFYDITNGTGSSATDLGQATVNGGVGAIPTAEFTQTGTRTLQAVWSGDPNYAPQSSSTVEVTVTSALGGSTPGGGGSTTTGSSSSGGSGNDSTLVARSSGDQLANTGSNLDGTLIAAAAVIAVGFAFTAASRRRRAPRSSSRP